MATGWFAPTGGFNCYFPMPFHRRARIELTNEHPGAVGGIYYQIDYTVDDELDDGTALFHAHWRRSNASTAPAEDHVILDGVVGSGNYVGTYIGLTALERFWWGEGEVKFYLDDGHFERSDDISSVAYWYQLPGGANDLPPLPSREHRRPR